MYNLAYQMATMPQNLEARYKADWSQWQSLAAPPNAYGNTSPLVNALNFGGLPQAQQGYNSAYVQPQTYPSGAYSSLDSRAQSTVANQYATSELAQSTTTNTLSTLGTIRADAQAFATKLANLESDTFSNDPSQQTQNALLGKINSATLLQIHSQQDTNQLLMTSIQQQLLVLAVPRARIRSSFRMPDCNVRLFDRAQIKQSRMGQRRESLCIRR
jgi:hypothetical protein